MRTIVGTMAPGPEQRMVAGLPAITVGHLSLLAEWLYWQHGVLSGHLRWTMSDGGAVAGAEGRDDLPLFVVVIGAEGKPVVRTEPLTRRSLGTGKRYTFADLRQDIADRIAESD